MSVADQIQDHQTRCLASLISLRMLAQGEAGTPLPRWVVVEVAQATGTVLALNCDPWHGQRITFAVGSYPTVQPACGHTASKATNWPGRGWITIDGSPVAGSWNEAACQGDRVVEPEAV